VTASEEQFLSLEDVANRLQVSDQTVRRWVKAGKLAAYKPGLEYRIRGSALEEFLKTREVRPKVPRRSPSEPSFNDVLEEERRKIFVQSCTQHAQARAARYQRRLKEAEAGGFFAGHEGALILFDEALGEYVDLDVLLTRELADLFVEDRPGALVSRASVEAIGALRPLREILERTSDRADELGETEAQKAEAERRREEIRTHTERLSA